MADEVLEEIPNEEEIEMAGFEERVNPLDPDFLLVLAFAILVDIIGGVIAVLAIIAALTGVGIVASVVLIKISGILNIIALVFISLWIFWRSRRIAERKRAKIEALQKRVKQLSKTATKITLRMARQLEKAAAKIGMRIAARLIVRVTIRGLVAFVGSIAPLVGLIPFWTISVVLMLREK